MKKSYKLAIALIAIVIIIGTAAFLASNRNIRTFIGFPVEEGQTLSEKERKRLVDMFMSAALKPKINKDEFDEVKPDLDVFIDFLKGYAEKNKNSENIILLLGGDIEYTFLTRRGRHLKLDDNTHESLLNIRKMFLGKYSWVTIEINSDFIIFQTIDGQYNLIYSIDGEAPAKKCPETERNYIITKIEDNWYHRVVNPG